MKIILFIFIYLSAVALYGQESNKTGCLKGNVGVLKGNCMPGPGKAPCEPSPLSTVIYITRPSKAFDKTLLIDSLKSDETGLFKVQLGIGQYSLFVNYEGETTCTFEDCNPECICHPILIQPNDTTFQDIRINKAVW